MSHANHAGHANFAGAMFLVAIVSSLAGGTLVQGALDQPDFPSPLSDAQWVVIAGAALEIVNALAVIGIAAALWPALHRSHPATTTGYLGVRLIEATVCAAAAFIPIAQLSLAGHGDHSAAQGTARLLTVIRDTMLSNAVPIFFSISAALLYLMLYRTALLPRYIAIWGFFATAAITANVFITIPELKPIFALPIIANEVYLGIYLLTRGLQPATPESGHASMQSDGSRR